MAATQHTSSLISKTQLIVMLVVITIVCFSAFLSFYDNFNSRESINTQNYRIDVPVLSTEELSIHLDSTNNALRRLTLDEVNTFVISTQIESILREIGTDLLPQISSPITFARFQFLIEKALPGPAGESFNNLLPSYLEYLKAEQVITDQRSTTENGAAEELKKLVMLKQLRRQHFDEETAQQLFGPQELLAEYMLNRQIIYTNDDLDENEKKSLLKKVAAQFQEEQDKNNNE